jgi:hypothetical protein
MCLSAHQQGDENRARSEEDPLLLVSLSPCLPVYFQRSCPCAFRHTIRGMKIGGSDSQFATRIRYFHRSYSPMSYAHRCRPNAKSMN